VVSNTTAFDDVAAAGVNGAAIEVAVALARARILDRLPSLSRWSIIMASRILLIAASVVGLSPAVANPNIESMLNTPIRAIDGKTDLELSAEEPSGIAPTYDAPTLQSLARYREAINDVQPDEALSTRGASDAALYKSVSPSVVLIVTEDGIGSGALIGTNGDIITNWHVVGGSEYVGVIFKPALEGVEFTDRDILIAPVVKIDQVADLALVRVSSVPARARPLRLISDFNVQVGTDVHAIGHPTGESWTYTKGLVSQVRKNYSWITKSNVEHKADVIQTQTPINPGNSGGPLLNDAMEIIGINSFKAEGEALNYAVSSKEVRRFLSVPGDRYAEAVASDCKGQILRSYRDEDGSPSLNKVIDTDCDGIGDFIVVTPDDPSRPVAVLADTNNDGNIDTILLDDNRDGDFDRSLVDTNADGKADLIGYFRPGESKPYRFEPI
jgi:S1-C subfamily serine protease